MLRKFLTLLCLGLRVRGRLFAEQCSVIARYYRSSAFAKADLLFLFSYLFQNPFRISRRYLQKQGETDVYTYGETSLTTMAEIVVLAEISAEDRVIELGCGRGRVCFWLRQWVGCDTIGVDIVPTFIRKAKRIQRWLGINRLQFREESMLKTSLEGVSVVYLYGICYDDLFLQALARKLQELPDGARVITVSFPMSDYGDGFETIAEKQLPFVWGDADVYVQRINKSIVNH